MSTRLPSLPRKPALPSRGRARERLTGGPEARGQATDEFGLSVTVFGKLPGLARQFLALSLEELHASKMVTPTQQGLGTIPEMIFFGGLLSYGFGFRKSGKGFDFQSDLLGGRIPGGSVTDFLIFNGPRRIAVFVQSPFHSYALPFAGGAKVEDDRNLFLRLQAYAGISAVIGVNQPDWGYPLERGPAMLIRREIERAINA